MSLRVFTEALRRQRTLDAVGAHIARYDIRAAVAGRLGLTLSELHQLAPRPDLPAPDPVVMDIRGVTLYDVVAAAGMRWAVRHDHPGGGHEFSGMRGTAAAAHRARRRDDAYWNHGLCRVPRRLTVVAIDPAAFNVHSRTGDCTSEACPR